MSLFPVGKRPSITRKTTVYGNFRGVDFSVDPSLVERSRSPYAPNLISDVGGMPEKRVGWRTLFSLGEGVVHGLYRTQFDGKEIFLAHVKDTLYQWNEKGETKVLKSGMADSRAAAFFAVKVLSADDSEGREEPEETPGLFFLTGKEYLRFDGTTVTDLLEDEPYVPHVVVANKPSGGGAALEPVNLLTPKRMESFVGTETDKKYQLTTKPVDSVVKVEVLNDDGKKEVLSSGQYTVDKTKGTVTFSAAHEAKVAGQPNIFITYTKEVAEHKEMVTKCTLAMVYGEGSSRQVFISGNPDYPSRIWFSYYNKPDYFPDNWYLTAGSEDNRVMGFLRIGRYLVVVKEENEQDATIFQIYPTSSSNGTLTYSIEQGAIGVGAISKASFASLVDEPLFLSSQGVMAIYSSNILAERAVRNRSYFLDAVLTKEEGLSEACAVEWNGYYLLALNNRCYVLDSKNKDYRHNTTDGTGDFVYECYHWENFPAVSFLSLGPDLFFGTKDGRICRLNTDITTMEKWSDDGEAIVAAWATKNDDDGASYLYKSMQKKGCVVTIKPYIRSSCMVYFAKDGEPEQFIRKSLMDIFSWENLDFERFSFNTNDSPQDVYLKKKVKKYKRLQLIIRNDGVGEGFGILQIAKTYIMGNYAKK